MSHLQNNRNVLNRIKRLQGQINAIHDAVVINETACLDVLQQVAAVRGAVNGLMGELIEAHLKAHVLEEGAYNEVELASFLALLKKYQ